MNDVGPCPICGGMPVRVATNLRRVCGRRDDDPFSVCREAERTAIERAAALDDVATVLRPYIAPCDRGEPMPIAAVVRSAVRTFEHEKARLQPAVADIAGAIIRLAERHVWVAPVGVTSHRGWMVCRRVINNADNGKTRVQFLARASLRHPTRWAQVFREHDSLFIVIDEAVTAAFRLVRSS